MRGQYRTDGRLLAVGSPVAADRYSSSVIVDHSVGFVLLVSVVFLRLPFFYVMFFPVSKVVAFLSRLEHFFFFSFALVTWYDTTR